MGIEYCVGSCITWRAFHSDDKRTEAFEDLANCILPSYRVISELVEANCPLIMLIC